MFLVSLPEEAGVVETGTQDTLMAMSNHAGRVTVGIEDGQEVGKQLAAGVLDCEILLMIAHHRDQNFLGQFQKFGIEAPEDGGRPLCQVDHTIEKRLILTPARAGETTSGGIE